VHHETKPRKTVWRIVYTRTQAWTLIRKSSLKIKMYYKGVGYTITCNRLQHCIHIDSAVNSKL